MCRHMAACYGKAVKIEFIYIRIIEQYYNFLDVPVSTVA